MAASTGALKGWIHNSFAFFNAYVACFAGINLRENSFTNLLPIKSLIPKNDEITSMIWSGTRQVPLQTC